MNATGSEIKRVEKPASAIGTWFALPIAAAAMWPLQWAVADQNFIVISGTLLATVVLCVILYTRVRAKQRWQAAWDRYAAWDLARGPFESAANESSLSLVGSNGRFG